MRAEGLGCPEMCAIDAIISFTSIHSLIDKLLLLRCWEIDNTGKSIPKAQQTMGGPILDVCWDDMGTKVFMASCDKQVS